MKVLLPALLAWAGAGCILPEPAPLTRFEFSESHMATPCEIKLYARDAQTAQAAAQEAYQEIAAIDVSMNDWKPDSELSRLSAASGGPEVAVSDRLFEVLEASLRISEFSQGAFDITVGPVVKLWRRIKKDARMASPEELRAAVGAVGYRHITLNPTKRTVRLDLPGMSLDVGGIAKGYACDRALAILARRGITRALVNTGGGMAFGDPPPGQPGWKIGLADTDQVLSLARCGVATSGDWERFVVIDGKRYSHVVDPRTGLGLTNRALVTVVAPTGMDADGLTKTVMVRGFPLGLNALGALPGTYAWLRWEEDGRTKTARTAGFDRLLLPD